MFKPSAHVPNPKDGYEKSDVTVMWVVYAAIGGAIFTAGSILVAVFYTTFLISDSPNYLPEGKYTPVAPMATDWTDPTRLQGIPAEEMIEHDIHAEHMKNTPGIVDKDAGIYRISVDDAINLVIENGALPKLKASEGAE